MTLKTFSCNAFHCLVKEILSSYILKLENLVCFTFRVYIHRSNVLPQQIMSKIIMCPDCDGKIIVTRFNKSFLNQCSFIVYHLEFTTCIFN